MQPVIMLVFIIFSLTAVDLAAFSGNYSIVYQIAGDASRIAPFSLNKYLTVNRTAAGAEAAANCTPSPDCQPIIVVKDREAASIKSTPRFADVDTIDPLDSRDLGGITDNLPYSECTKENIDKAVAEGGPNHPLKQFCDARYSIRVALRDIDWVRLAAARQPPVENVTPKENQTPQQAAGQQIARQVIAAVFFCVMVVFVLNGLVAVVPKIISDLVGDALQSADLNSLFGNVQGGGQQNSLSGKIGAAISGLGGSIKPKGGG
jgi:hypothetical protein